MNTETGIYYGRIAALDSMTKEIEREVGSVSIYLTAHREVQECTLAARDALRNAAYHLALALTELEKA